MGLWCSPTFWKIHKSKSVEEFKPDPYIATVLNCMFWVFYGMPFVHPDSTLIVTINGIGLVIELVYLAFFCWYADSKARVTILNSSYASSPITKKKNHIKKIFIKKKEFTM